MSAPTRASVSGAQFAVTDPATGRIVGRAPDSTPADGLAAVERAHAALPDWSARGPRARSEVLMRLFHAMHDEAESLRDLIVSENGKSPADAASEVAYAAEFFRWYAEEIVRPDGSFTTAPGGGARHLVGRRPVGVAALVTPWNFPAAMVTRKVAPALAAGCTMVLKPAPETPLTALALARLMIDSGVPEDVVRVVPTTDGPAMVDAWLADHRVRKLSFTGSTQVGRILLRRAADRVVNVSMELGGNAPFIVTAGADLEAAVDGAMIAKFRNAGQACTAANRFYVHESVLERFTALLGERVERLTVGPGASGADIGPMISGRAQERVLEQIEQAVTAGAVRAHVAPLPAALTGHFVAPTVLTQVPADAPFLAEELFGPVAPIVSWSDEDDVIARANDSEYGLAAYVFEADLTVALRIAESLEAGMVGVNRGLVSDPSAPFGGVKQSGVGREGAREGLHEFTEMQYLSVDWPR